MKKITVQTTVSAAVLFLLSLFCILMIASAEARHAMTRQADAIWSAFVIGAENSSTNSRYQLTSSVGGAWLDMPAAQANRLQTGFLNDALLNPDVTAINVTAPTTNASVAIGSALTINWETVGNIQNVKIEVSRDNGQSWRVIAAQSPNDGSEQWLAGRPRSNQCLIRVSDAQSNTIHGISAQFAITPQRAELQNKPTAQPAGTTVNAYRMISVPMTLDNSSVDAVLGDELAPYDTTRWRVFDRRNDRYIEHSSTRGFTPGRSLFLITRDGARIDAGPGFYVADSVVRISLDAGWNLIANPYHDFNLPLSALSPAVTPQTYTGNGFSPVNQLIPWEGYIVRVASATTLTIRLPEQQFGKASELPWALADGEWQVQIKAESQNARDYFNFAGYREQASVEFDQYDYFEPPPIGEYISLYFPHRDWQHEPYDYGGDFRAFDGEGETWEFEVKSNIRDVVRLSFAELETVPLHLQVWLIDPVLKLKQDVRANPVYEYNHNRSDKRKQLQLVIGSAGYVGETAGDFYRQPNEFALSQNYPNPFNPSTTIRFILPAAEKVTLTVVNLLGERVSTILDGEEKAAGHHVLIWNGKTDDGRQLASGVYLLHLRTATQSQTRKMVMTK